MSDTLNSVFLSFKLKKITISWVISRSIKNKGGLIFCHEDYTESFGWVSEGLHGSRRVIPERRPNQTPEVMWRDATKLIFCSVASRRSTCAIGQRFFATFVAGRGYGCYTLRVQLLYLKWQLHGIAVHFVQFICIGRRAVAVISRWYRPSCCEVHLYRAVNTETPKFSDFFAGYVQATAGCRRLWFYETRCMVTLLMGLNEIKWRASNAHSNSTMHAVLKCFIDWYRILLTKYREYLALCFRVRDTVYGPWREPLY